ncbi:MAG: 50S ribosomal protein L24 [Planctomycetota bacterium]
MPAIRKGDLVEVISGNDRGKRGRVLRVLPRKHRVVVQGVNLRWKHMRRSRQAPKGGRLRREVPVHVSNVMVYDEGAGRRTRLGTKVVGGKRVRISRVTGQEMGGAAPEKKAAKQKAPKAPKKETVRKAAAKKTAKKTPARKSGRKPTPAKAQARKKTRRKKGKGSGGPKE